MLCELVHGGDIGDAAGEADYIAPARIRSEPGLDGRDRTHGVEKRAGRRRESRIRSQFGEGSGVDLAVLAHLEPCQVKAERLHLPDQMLQLAVGLAARARGSE